ncbi:MAG: hypothetical protein E7415_00825 [Ruminococcaceae bacterium]|nr:hypothetical protein [Oscillospiraceae bacterium]
MLQRKVFSVLIAVLMLFMSFDVSAKTYPDVPEDSKAYEAVDYLSEIGVVSGYEDGLFVPDRNITRGEAVALLARTLGYEEDYEIKIMPFEDVAVGYWAERFISYCWEGGLVNGMTENSFEPAGKVTYAQMIKMLVCASGFENEVIRPDGGKWYDGYINTANKYGITENVEVFPDESAPRGEVVVLVYNCVKKGLICSKEQDETDTETENDEEFDNSFEEDVVEDEDDFVEEDFEDEEDVTIDDADSDKEQPAVAYKEDVVKTVSIPDDYEFAKGYDYVPFFEDEEVDYSELSQISEEDKLLIVVDPGHNFSGTDIGAHNETYEVWEQNVTWPVAEMLRRKLEYMGFEVVMTRDNLNDNIKGETLKEALVNRAGIANGLEADLFISIHCNAGGGKGVETYCFRKNTKGERLAKSVQSYLAKETGLFDRGVKTAEFVVIKETVMPAILVETAFIDRDEDFEFLVSKDGQNKLSTAIAKGVYDYVTTKAVGESVELKGEEDDEETGTSRTGGES